MAAHPVGVHPGLFSEQPRGMATALHSTATCQAHGRLAINCGLADARSTGWHRFNSIFNCLCHLPRAKSEQQTCHHIAANVNEHVRMDTDAGNRGAWYAYVQDKYYFHCSKLVNVQICCADSPMSQDLCCRSGKLLIANDVASRRLACASGRQLWSAVQVGLLLMCCSVV